MRGPEPIDSPKVRWTGPSIASVVSKVSTVDPVLQERADLLSKRRQDSQEMLARESLQKHQEAQNTTTKVKGWAIVKAVNSGDQIVLVGKNSSAQIVLEEKVLHLSKIVSPRFFRDGSEDFAHESREFLRTLLLGKRVYFEVTFVHEASERNFGTVLLENQDVCRILVEKGFAKVKKSTAKSLDSDQESLLVLQSKAQIEGRGIWNQNVSQEKRQLKFISLDQETRRFLDEFKDKLLIGSIEQVRDGATLLVEIVDPYERAPLERVSIILHLAGIKCPPIAYSAQPGERSGDSRSEPYALEAKIFTELRLLHRLVPIQLLAVDKSGIFFGRIVVPQGNIAMFLLKNGLASLVEWSASLSPDRATLEAAEAEAKTRNLNIWQIDGNRDRHDRFKTEKDFVSKVVQIFSGDSLLVLSPSGQEMRIFLASVRAPRLSTQDQTDEAFARESREFLRKRLIGKSVKVKLEYSHSSISEDLPKRIFASILHSNDDVALCLIREGLATVISHRLDEERASLYDEMLVAEQEAKCKGKGLHGKNTSRLSDIIDLTMHFKNHSSAAASQERLQRSIRVKCNQLLPFLKKKRIHAIVEYVFTGHRIKVFVPQENCLLSVVLCGIRCPSPSRPGRTGESFGDEALAFLKRMILQREVLLEVVDIDKGNNFIATVFFSRRNMCLELLYAGLGQMLEYSADHSAYKDSLLDAQVAAKSARLNIWKDFVEPPNEVKDEVPELPKIIDKEVELRICEIVDPVSFYFHVSDVKPVLDEIQKELDGLSLRAFAAVKPKKGECYAGLFVDGKFYRCRILRMLDYEAQVQFIDFGNTDFIPLSSLRPLSSHFADIPPCAQYGCLPAVKYARDLYAESLDAFGTLVWDQKLLGRIICCNKAKGGVFVSLRLLNEDSSATVVERCLLEEGFLRVSSKVPHPLDKLVPFLQEAEQKAKLNHLRIWQYGDVSSDESIGEKQDL